MSLRASAAHSSRIRKPSKPPAFKRNPSTPSPYSSLPRRKPTSTASKKPSLKKSQTSQAPPQDPSNSERLPDCGILDRIFEDLILRDVPQAIKHIFSHMFSPLDLHNTASTGMSSTRIAELLQYRRRLPPLVTVAHVKALLTLSPSAVEREIAEMQRAGVVRKLVVPGRGGNVGAGEVLILAETYKTLINGANGLSESEKKGFVEVLERFPGRMRIEAREFGGEGMVRKLVQAGFLTGESGMEGWNVTAAFSGAGGLPGDEEGKRGSLTSIHSISRAASGTFAAVGGVDAVHASGGSGGGTGTRFETGGAFGGDKEFLVAAPSTGSFLKLLAEAKAHLVALLGKSRFREAPEKLLRERWDGNVGGEDTSVAGERRRIRGEFKGVMMGGTRKWKAFWGVSFDWVLGEAVGAGLVEVFETGSVGRGVQAL